MENQEKATQVLDRQIADVQEKMIQTKVNIADLFIRTYEVDIRKIHNPKDMIPYMDNISDLFQLLEELKGQQNVFAALTKSRAEIDLVLTGAIVK